MRQTVGGSIGGNTEWDVFIGNASMPSSDVSGSITERLFLTLKLSWTGAQGIGLKTTFMWSSSSLRCRGSPSLSPAAAPARVAMTVISMLTLSGIDRSILASLPRLSGDVWLLRVVSVSWVFSVFSVVEYVLANFLYRSRNRLLVALKDFDEQAMGPVLQKRPSGVTRLAANHVSTLASSEEAEIAGDEVDVNVVNAPSSPNGIRTQNDLSCDVRAHEQGRWRCPSRKGRAQAHRAKCWPL